MADTPPATFARSHYRNDRSQEQSWDWRPDSDARARSCDRPRGVGSEPAELVRESISRSRAAGTAVLRFVPLIFRLGDSLADTLEDRGHRSSAVALRLADQLTGHVRAAAGISEIGGRPGVADFRQERFLIDEGHDDVPQWTIFTPGEEYANGPDDWEVVRDDATLIGYREPAWLLALIEGVVDAHREGSEHVLGQPSTRYEATVSFSEAAIRSSRTLQRPVPVQNVAVDPDRLPSKVWLDDDGRLVKAVLRLGRGVMIIELSEFGVPEPVALPDPDCVWSSENELHQ